MFQVSTEQALSKRAEHSFVEGHVPLSLWAGEVEQALGEFILCFGLTFRVI